VDAGGQLHLDDLRQLVRLDVRAQALGIAGHADHALQIGLDAVRVDEHGR